MWNYPRPWLQAILQVIWVTGDFTAEMKSPVKLPVPQIACKGGGGGGGSPQGGG